MASSEICCREKKQTSRHSSSVNFYVGICRDCTRQPGVFTPLSYIHLIDFENLISLSSKFIKIFRGGHVETT